MVQAVGTFHSWGWQINILLSVAGKKKKSMTDLNCVPIPIMFCRLESHGA